MWFKKTIPEWKLPPVWLRFLLVIVLTIGLFFRFIHNDHLVYSYDESYSSLRISGHTRAEVIQQAFNGGVTTVGEFQAKYQAVNPDKGLSDTIHGLAVEEAQLTPLYFSLVRIWAGIFGSSVAAVRSFSGVISLLVLPCAFWLCLELFGSPLVGWLAIALMAVSPFHVLYAKDARPYILLAMMILLSGALLLRALRTQTRASWGAYSVALALGLYSHLLFVPVLLAQGVYVVATQGLRVNRAIVAYAIAAASAVCAFVPWVVTMVLNSMSVVQRVGAPGKAFSPMALLSELKPLSRYSCRIFLDAHWAGGIVNLGTGNVLNKLIQPLVGVLLIGLIAYAVYWLCRQTRRETWLFVLLLAGVPLVMLLLQGGIADRYLFAYYLAVQLTVAYLIATHLTEAKTIWQQKLFQVVLVVVLSAGVVSAVISSNSQVWSIKFPSFSEHNPAVARVLNQAQDPLVVIHQPNTPFTGSAVNEAVGRLMALSHLLNSTVHLQLTQSVETLTIPTQFSQVFVYQPSKALRNQLEKVQNYRLIPVEPLQAPWLWRVERTIALKKGDTPGQDSHV